MPKTLLFILLVIFNPLASGAQVQWASRVIGFSSEYNGSSPHQYRSEQVLGKPNKLPAVGDSPCAWSSSTKDGSRYEWIKVAYQEPVSICQVAIAENYNPGAVSHIFLYDLQNREYQIYHDSAVRRVGETGRMLNVFILPTPYKVTAVKIVLDVARVPGWNQIDAIGISSSMDLIRADIRLPENVATESIAVENLRALNSDYVEVMPVISPDGKTLYFDRKDHPGNTPGLVENDDIWYSTLDAAGGWSTPRHMPPPLNNYKNNYVCAATPDGSALLLANIYQENSRKVGGVSLTQRLKSSPGEQKWSFPREVKIDNYYNNNMFSEYFMAANRRILLLAIERNDTWGGRDLYVSFLKPDSTWTAPKNLGQTINTAATELTPFLAADGRSLYFSSNGFSGYGTTDMYLSKRLDDTWTNWSEPVNLGKPFNSEAWDASYTLDASGDYAYFVSYSQGENVDLYRARLPEALKPEPVILLSGKVYHAVTHEVLEVPVSYHSLPPGQERGFAQVNPVTQEYKVVLPVQHRYSLMAVHQDFIAVAENIDLSVLDQYREIRRDLYLVPVEAGQRFMLNNVFFAQGTAVLLPESYPELDRLAEVLTQRPTMEIELSGHTDIEGSPIENMKLSKARVAMIKTYFTGKGISERRIATKAYGARMPVSTARDDLNKQLNRRVEFKILKL